MVHTPGWSTLEDSFTINWLGTDHGVEFGSSYGQRLKFLRTTQLEERRRGHVRQGYAGREAQGRRGLG